jgi:serine/threonine protein kinase/formylglycine-generating enzyme required for sulfatase activity
MSPMTSRWPGPPLLLEEYRRIRLLGAGSMGQVYLYQDTELDRPVAVKFLHRLEPGFGRRFRTEALAAAKVQHPNVVTIHRVNEIDGRPYLVYEYIRGISLEELPRPVPWRRAHAIGLDLARGLAAAHRRGVLHRDIKPGNAILDSETGEAKLIDFGLAKIVLPNGVPPDGLEAGQEESNRVMLAPSEPREPAPVDHAPAAEAASAPGPVSDDRWGTLPYTAPEVLAGEAATQRSDVYALGVVLHELCTGVLPERSQLSGEVAPPMSDLSDVDAGFAAIIRRCLDMDPVRRYADGDELRRALEALATSEKNNDIPAGNPYRGLLQFEAGHRALFFGRGPDTRDVIDRLYAQRFVLLSGESGVGKSSLARAGVLPAIEEGALAQGRAWSTAIFEPGRWPLAALLQLLAARLGADEDALLADVQAGDLAAIAARMRRRHGDTSGTVLFIDQLEELVTWSDPEEAAAAAELIAALAERVRGLRILATARADQLARLAELPRLGQLLERNLVLVRPLGKDAIRETILGPARLTGVRFESDELVDELVDSSAQAEGGLPLLQFALAELWKSRDTARNMITQGAFDRLGGVAGALTQHADRVLAGWDRARLDAARRILLRLVTSHRTRARCTSAELLSSEPGRRDVLDSLVAGRLVVVSTSEGQAVYTLAHEALLRSWTTLRHWLDEGEGAKAVMERVGQAAGEWERTGRTGVALWGPTQLAEAQNLDQADLSEREAAFLAASGRAIRSRKRKRQLTFVGAVLVAAMAYGGMHLYEKRKLADRVERQVELSQRALRQAQRHHLGFAKGRTCMEAELHRGSSIEAPERVAAEACWKDAVEHADFTASAYQEASLELEVALSLDPSRDDVRARMADVLDAQVRLADETGRIRDRDAFLARLGVYDLELRKSWAAPVDIAVHTEPSGARVTIERYPHPSDGCLGGEPEIPDRVLATPFRASLSPGSYVLVVHGDERHAAVSYPFFVRCGQQPGQIVALRIARPSWDAVPDGFVFVPEGRFLFGYGTSSADESRRKWYGTVPLHERETGSYLIARHETTFDWYMEYLQACYPDRCPGSRPHLPRVEADMTGGISAELRSLPDNDWELEIEWPGTATRRLARRGQSFIYPERTMRREQSWEQFPVIGISREDAQEFVQWLRATGRLPRARLCREDEWERAARGADDRLFPHGNTIERDQANYDETYGRRPLAYGPDAVGSYETSVSPFGLYDMPGNVWEIVEPILDRSGLDTEQPPDAIGGVSDDSSHVVVRGGSYYQHSDDSATVNSWSMGRNQRDGKVGFRVCADVAR